MIVIVLMNCLVHPLVFLKVQKFLHTLSRFSISSLALEKLDFFMLNLAR